MKLTSVGVCGAHHNHRGADASRFPQTQTVVLLLGEHWHLVVGIIHIYDHLQGMCVAVNQLYILSLRMKRVLGKGFGNLYPLIKKLDCRHTV